MNKLLLCLFLVGSTSGMERSVNDLMKVVDEASALKVSTDSNTSNARHSHLRLAIVSALAGLGASAITAAVTLAVHFTECNKYNNITNIP